MSYEDYIPTYFILDNCGTYPQGYKEFSDYKHDRNLYDEDELLNFNIQFYIYSLKHEDFDQFPDIDFKIFSIVMATLMMIVISVELFILKQSFYKLKIIKEN